MCRNIKRLREGNVPASDEAMEEAALQYVRKVSGFPKPSKANEEAFSLAVKEIARASRQLLHSLEVKVPA